MKNRTSKIHPNSIIALPLFAALMAPLLLGFFMNLASAEEYVLKRDKNSNSRSPASIMGTDDLYVSPMEQEIWLNTIMIEDDRGILSSISNNLQQWESIDEYAAQWNLTSTGLFQTPTYDQRKSYLSKHLLKYVDRRISGEVKNAEVGSTFHTVGQVQENLKPETSVQMAANFRLRFKARVLEGQANMVLENPYFNNTTTFNYKGHLNVNVNKDFKDLKVRTNLDVNFNEGLWQASLDRPIAPNLSGRIAARHTEAYDEEAIVQVHYGIGF